MKGIVYTKNNILS